MPDVTRRPEAPSTNERTFPEGTFQRALDEVRSENPGGFAGGQFTDRARDLVRQHVPDLPPHLVEIAWKIAILRDHVLTIEPDLIEVVAMELLSNDEFVESLQDPDLISFLNTTSGMDQAVTLFQEKFGLLKQ